MKADESEIKVYIPPLNTTEGKVMMLLFEYPHGLSLRRISIMMRQKYDTILPAIVRLMEDGIVKIKRKGSRVERDVFCISEEFLKKLPSDELLIAEIDNTTMVVNELLEEARKEEERIKKKLEKKKKLMEEQMEKTGKPTGKKKTRRRGTRKKKKVEETGGGK